jgi:hypothetical protein
MIWQDCRVEVPVKLSAAGVVPLRRDARYHVKREAPSSSHDGLGK